MTNGRLWSQRDTCRLCGSQRLWMAVPLPALVIASPNVGTDSSDRETAPADVYGCEDCGFVQLAAVVDPEYQYRSFRYVTGISLGLRAHFAGLIDGLAARGELTPGDLVVDIGSNDGSLLAIAKTHGARVIGVDPAEAIAMEATRSGIPTLAEFFDRGTARRIVADHGTARLVISNNTVANIDHLEPFFAAISDLVAPTGLVIVETQYLLDVLGKTLLDVIYHEHISYFAIGPMERFLRANDFELVDAERIAPKGGSIRFTAQRRGGGRVPSRRLADLRNAEMTAGLYENAIFDGFAARIRDLGECLRSRLKTTKAASGRAFAYGASVGCAALVQYFDLAAELDAIFDDTPLGPAMRTGARDIPIRPGRSLEQEAATDVLVLAWRYADAIAGNQQAFIDRGGCFYRALPDLTFVGA